MKPKQPAASMSHDEAMIALLRDDPDFAAEYLQAAIEEVEEEGGQHGLLKALRLVAEARGVAKVAKSAGIPRESLYRALSSRGNPRLSTLSAIVRGMGLQLTVSRPQDDVRG